MNSLDDFELEELKNLQCRFNNIGNTQQIHELKTKYLVIASSLRALITKLEHNKNGRYE
jgi:hypothetical protein